MPTRMNRRDFLKYAALAAGVAAGPRWAWSQAAGGPVAGNKLNVAFIGVGGARAR